MPKLINQRPLFSQNNNILDYKLCVRNSIILHTISVPNLSEERQSQDSHNNSKNSNCYFSPDLKFEVVHISP